MKIKFSIVFLLFILFLWIFGQIPRAEFWQSFSFYTIIFGFYLILNKWAKNINLTIYQVLLMALLSRLVFMGLPLHSDDFYRFYWDGQLLLHQLNPFEYTPKELLDMDMVPNILHPVYEKLNSPQYYSIYPVTNQAVFTFAAWLGGASLFSFVLWVRFILVIFEMVSVWILFKILTQLKIPSQNTLIYALNPLILLEITGNLHFEGMMVTFIFFGFWALLLRKNLISGGLIGSAIAVKLTPLILLPMILKYLGIRRFLWFTSALVLVLIVFFIPIILSGTVAKYFTSLQLYYGKFEFNASVYYLMRELGYLFRGYNMIESLSQLLSFTVFSTICYIAYKANIRRFHHLVIYGIFAYSIYLMLSIVVHPWYIIPLIGLGVIGGVKYPLAWSYLIFLSYHAYSENPYTESYALISIQYGLLAIFATSEFAQNLSSKKSYNN